LASLTIAILKVVREVLLMVAKGHPDILADPSPEVSETGKALPQCSFVSREAPLAKLCRR
jgi:hypothetical protein